MAQEEFGCVAMVGDGVNDAAALATADVGVALACGADITRDTAQVCLLGNDLMKLPWAIDLARKTMRTIRWNLFWAYSYNAFAIGVAASGALHPIIAAGVMVASSVIVITNSLRLSQGEEDAAIKSDGKPARDEGDVSPPPLLHDASSTQSGFPSDRPDSATVLT